MSFISLPTGKLYKKSEKKKLKNFPAGYVGKFYRNLVDNVDTFLGSDFYGRIANDGEIPSKDVQKYILATSDFAKGIQTDINHHITRDRINNSSFRQKLDPISKNILRRQNSLGLVFEDVPTFDAEKPIVGSLLRELEVGKKDTASELIKKAPGTPGLDFVIQNRLNKLKESSSRRNNLSQSPSPPPPSFFQPPPPPPLPPSLFCGAERYVPPPQPTKPPPSNFNLPPPPPFPPTDPLFGSHVMTKERKEEEKEKIIDEIDENIYELPDLPKLELGDQLRNTLGAEAEDILKAEYVTSKELEDKNLEEIKEEYNFDEIKDAFDHAAVPSQLELFYGGDNENSVRACNFLSPNEDNNEFVSYLCSDRGQNIMTNNSLSVHIESGNIFYQNFNTNENFYSFLLAQQDETKKIIPKRIAYHHSFEKYIKNYLPSFSIKEAEKSDVYANKNSKYLHYKFNDWIESLGAGKLLIRHTSKAQDTYGLKN